MAHFELRQYIWQITTDGETRKVINRQAYQIVDIKASKTGCGGRVTLQSIPELNKTSIDSDFVVTLFPRQPKARPVAFLPTGEDPNDNTKNIHYCKADFLEIAIIILRYAVSK